MKCKYCQQELEDSASVCPACGKAVPPSEGKNTSNVLKIVVASVGTVVLLVLLAWVVYYGVTGNLYPWGNAGKDGGTEPTGSVPSIVKPTDGVFVKDSYTADTSTEEKRQAFLAQMDTVVAKVGDSELTNGQLQVLYWMEVYDYISLASQSGYPVPDLSKPLQEQICDATTGQTWEQYLLESALSVWHQYQLMTNDANAKDFQIPEKFQKDFENLEKDLEEAAKKENYATAMDFLTGTMGVGANTESYRHYMTLFYTASLYYDHLAANAEVTEKEAQEYFANDAYNLYYYYGITAAVGKNVDVRHILIMPEGGTKDATTGAITYSEAEWEACRAKAQAIYDAWLAGNPVNEDTFAALAKEHSQDGNAKDGGIYTNVYEGQMVKTFNDWCFDENRKTGDHGLVKTDYGYHVMYFVKNGYGINARILEAIQNEKAAVYLQEILKKNSLTVEYESIVLSGIELKEK